MQYCHFAFTEYFVEEETLSEFEEIELPQPQQQSQQQSQIDSLQPQKDRQPKQAPGFKNSGQVFGIQAQNSPAKFGSSFSDISSNINPFGGAQRFPGLQNQNPFKRGQFPNNQMRSPFDGVTNNNNIFNNKNIFNPNNSPSATRQGALGAAFSSPGGLSG